MLWPRTRDAVRLKLIDPKFGTELGRLLVVGRITQTQFDAAQKWAGVVSRYGRALKLPKPWAKTSDLERGQERPSPPREDDPGVADERDECKTFNDARNAYDKALTALIGMSDGREVLQALKALVLRGEPLPYQDFLYAERGLNTLELNFGLTRRPK